MHADREILRPLAARAREIAEDSSMPKRKARWIGHNALRSERPMVLCFPEGAWEEILPESACRCADPALREVERQLRARIYWWEHLRDDNAAEPYFNVNWKMNVGDFGVAIPRVQGDNRGSFIWDPPIKDLDRDFSRLHQRDVAVDREATAAWIEKLTGLFGDLLPVRIRGHFWWTVGLTMSAAYLFGIEEIMLATYDNPGALHRLMAFLRDDCLNVMRYVEREGLLSADNQNDYTGSGGVAYTDELPSGPVTPNHHMGLRDVWGFAESQETVAISPMQFEEFVLPYQIPLLNHFGLACYGCCEPMELRFAAVARAIPRLRRVSVAPLANQKKLAEQLDGRFIYSRKCDPTKVCVGFNEEGIRSELRQTLQITRGQPVELIMKDTHTVQSDPARLSRWVGIAFEEIERAGWETGDRDLP